MARSIMHAMAAVSAALVLAATALDAHSAEAAQGKQFAVLAPEPLKETEQGAEPDSDFTVIRKLTHEQAVAARPTVDHFGITVLHRGQAYSGPVQHTSFSPPTGADTAPGVNRMVHHQGRIFVSWRGHEHSPGNFNFTARADGVPGQNKIGLADYHQARGIKFVVNSGPNGFPQWHDGGYYLGPPATEAGWKAWVNAVLTTFVPKGMIAWEILNEPESTSPRNAQGTGGKGWWGTLNASPKNPLMRRQAAESIGPWVRYTREAIDAYNAANGTKIELWGFGCQAMGGVGATMMAPAAKTFPGTYGLLSSPDGKGGQAHQHLHRISFHGYTSPTWIVWPHPKTKAGLTTFLETLKGFASEIGRPDIPLVDTEWGVIGFRNNKNFKGDYVVKKDGTPAGHVEWKTDNPYTGAPPAMTLETRSQRFLAPWAILAIYGARGIWYAADEREMGMYGSEFPRQNPANPFGWVDDYQRLEARYAWLRNKLLTNNVYQLRIRNADNVYQVLLGTTLQNAKWVHLT